MKAEWICKDCYKKLDKEYECFTDYNWLQLKCFYCGKQIGEYHVVNPPAIINQHTEQRKEE